MYCQVGWVYSAPVADAAITGAAMAGARLVARRLINLAVHSQTKYVI